MVENTTIVFLNLMGKLQDTHNIKITGTNGTT